MQARVLQTDTYRPELCTIPISVDEAAICCCQLNLSLVIPRTCTESFLWVSANASELWLGNQMRSRVSLNVHIQVLLADSRAAASLDDCEKKTAWLSSISVLSLPASQEVACSWPRLEANLHRGILQPRLSAVVHHASTALYISLLPASCTRSTCHPKHADIFNLLLSIIPNSLIVHLLPLKASQND